MKQGTPVAIAGAGIAGLTAALSFARKGIPAEIFERTSILKEAGAGIQLSPNATRILTRLGLLERLEKIWSEPETVNLVDGRSLRTIATVPSGRFARHRWNAPYGVLHRADLQKTLLDAVNANSLCRLHLGQNVETPNAIAGIIGTPPRLIVGADGVWSDLRQHVEGAGKAAFSGNVAWRLTFGEADAPAVFDTTKVMAFLGNGAHLVVYPLPQKRSFNIVAIAGEADPGKTWDRSLPTDEARQRLLDAFSGWHPQLASILRAAVEPTLWPLWEVEDGAWNKGNGIVLIGDAAHAMMPFAAQGAAMAIEDAFELATFVADGKPLTSFIDHRKSRVARVRSRGAFNRFAYHARGPVRLGRDLVLSLRRPESLAADFDWLYGYEPKD
jgi:salicylate hydroxylase